MEMVPTEGVGLIIQFTLRGVWVSMNSKGIMEVTGFGSDWMTVSQEIKMAEYSKDFCGYP